MKSLDEAWEWYLATRKNLERFRRMADKHWEFLPWESSPLGRDDDFRTLTAEMVVVETRLGLKPFDDIAVLVLFSVFEAEVRDHIGEEIEPLAEAIQHPVLKAAANEVVGDVENGSFGRLMEKYKPSVGPNLVEMVNQVRRYRNWVAHGRRGEMPPEVNPRVAHERLSEFLQSLRGTTS